MTCMNPTCPPASAAASACLLNPLLFSSTTTPLIFRKRAIRAMRLIKVETRLFEDWIGYITPKYAILSHTWEEEEVAYSHYVRGGFEGMKGYGKIDMTCRIAKEQGIPYAWVDTCCIDKSSSSELSEAINSMYRWYQRAQVCYVYLSDLPHGANWHEELPQCRW